VKHDAVLERLRAAVFDAPGALCEPPPDAGAFVEKVRRHAYRVTDADVDALRAAGLDDEQIFELTIATALATGVERLR
jgi:alkylhydroperoxidase family enzyme